MSEQMNETGDQRLGTLFQKVYLPAFMSKLAEFGVTPRNDDELQDVLKLAVLTRAGVEKNAEAAPAADAQASLLKQAVASLESALTSAPPTAADILADPEVAAALR